MVTEPQRSAHTNQTLTSLMSDPATGFSTKDRETFTRSTTNPPEQDLSA